MSDNRMRYEGKQTSPDTYSQAFKAKYEKGIPAREIMAKDEEEKAQTDAMLHLWKVGSARNKSQWSDEQFKLAVDEYFDYIQQHNIKPSKAGLSLWLGCSKDTYHEWTHKKEKYPFKSEVLVNANLYMETSYINRGEKYPTFNTFLLKSSHGHIEQSKIDITTNGNDVTSADEVRGLVSKLGLDKK